MPSPTLFRLFTLPLLSMAGLLSAAEWVRVDDFQDRQPGPFQRQESGWHLASSEATLVEVADDRDNPGNRAIKIRHLGKPNAGDNDIFWQNSALAITPGNSGSLFLRFKVENGTDELGNTNGSEPVQDISFNIALGPSNLHAGNMMGGVRIAGKKANLVDFRSKGPKPTIEVKRNRWYRFWLLVDNRPGASDNRSTAFLQEEGSTEPPKQLTGTFLREGTPGIISSVGFLKARNSNLTDIWVDDIYIDPNGLNTTDPMNDKTEGWREKFAKEAKQYAQYTQQAATWEQARNQAQHLVAAMTPAERFALVCGDGAAGTSAFLRFGIQDVQFNDASCGINNGAPGSSRRERLPKTVAHPALCLLAATWDPEIAKAYGKALGEECRSGGTKVLLGPGMNICRASIDGRNFEYMGEDPLLASRMIAGYVQGMQSTGTASTLKHFIGNELENHRRGTNSIIDERALHEIYMPAFKAGINAGALAVMTSYNQLNGEWASESSYVNTTLLRKELGFQGVIMTDWIAAYDGLKVAAAGTDLEMPFGGALVRSREALLGSANIDRMCQSVLATWIKAGFFDPQWKKPELEQHRPVWEATARATNIAGIVLLQNDGILPLAGGYAGKTILVTGANAERLELSGNGSGHVPGYDSKTYLDMCRELFPQATVVSAEAPTPEQIHSANLILAFPGFLDRPRKDRPGSAEGEGQDRSFAMPDDAIISACTSGNPRTIVCVVAGAGVAMDWADQAVVCPSRLNVASRILPLFMHSS
jgi:beta-glucosidase-like glycosyl hydrolase